MSRRPTGARPRPRRITLVVYDDVQILDVTGPHEVFALADRFVRHPPPAAGVPDPLAAGEASPPAAGEASPPATGVPYELEVVASGVDAGGTVRSSSGLRLGVDRRVGTGRRPPADGAIDTLVVAGGEGAAAAMADESLLGWLTTVAPRCRRVASVCSGAFLLAAAGLLDGRRATTHWSACDTLAARFPAVTVEPDPIFVRDGPVTTSAGITAGMDLALALVEEDLGRDLAGVVARWLVMFVQRPGGQSQFSSQLAAQLAERQPLRELQAWIAEHPAGDLTVAALAARVNLSPRHFARLFRDETGTTPARYVERQRVEVARRLLETTDRSVEQVARAAGFGTAESLQRAFRRRVGTRPRDYRNHFNRSGASRDR